MVLARIGLAAALVVTAFASPRAAQAFGPRRGGSGGGSGGPVVVATTLTADEEARLRYLREEEKLARDVYATLFARWGVIVFSRISSSEQHHTDAIRTLIEKYGVEDPAAATPPGVFVSSELQHLHDSLVSMGLASPAAALAVGVLMEETDVADLQEAMEHTAKIDLLEVFG